jgi:hypothetical protein
VNQEITLYMKRIITLLALACFLVGCSTQTSPQDSAPQPKVQTQTDPEADRAFLGELGFDQVLGSNELPVVRKAIQDYAAKAYTNCLVLGVTSGLRCRGTYLSSVDLACKDRKTQNPLTLDVAVRMFVKDTNDVYWKAENASKEYTALFTACLQAGGNKRKQSE